MQDKIIFFQNKKADSNLIAIVTMLLLVVISLSAFWMLVLDNLNLSPQISCSDFEFKNSLKINRACYLNENEIIISLERKLDSEQIDSLEFDFGDFGFLLKDKSFGCSDIREFDSEYGRACEVIQQGLKKDYVFFVGDEENSKNIFVGVYLSEDNEMCVGARKEISASC